MARLASPPSSHISYPALRDPRCKHRQPCLPRDIARLQLPSRARFLPPWTTQSLPCSPIVRVEDAGCGNTHNLGQEGGAQEQGGLFPGDPQPRCLSVGSGRRNSEQTHLERGAWQTVPRFQPMGARRKGSTQRRLQHGSARELQPVGGRIPPAQSAFLKKSDFLKSLDQSICTKASTILAIYRTNRALKQPAKPVKPEHGQTSKSSRDLGWSGGGNLSCAVRLL